jgi:hypothetical protein
VFSSEGAYCRGTNQFSQPQTDPNHKTNMAQESTLSTHLALIHQRGNLNPWDEIRKFQLIISIIHKRNKLTFSISEVLSIFFLVAYRIVFFEGWRIQVALVAPKITRIKIILRAELNLPLEYTFVLASWLLYDLKMTYVIPVYHEFIHAILNLNQKRTVFRICHTHMASLQYEFVSALSDLTPME